ncbi:Uncharacterised protein [Mycobacteroides abscessus subsp. massiliense]|uniref:helix-turn-helix domain-containing protein n=1 Tax=Mycobacteroides abscessus TaxID=36809 RepID=UPI0009A7499B|nr:helix-turn-helix transcriptional regulator [Mycobacteroides abscessus]MBN7324444.1 helix-turn-helix domain-containing protein [Mycobacteroides abscessus subsp. massiliense]SKF37278.1 Uncharacterised protein [Mycobacteroides abscessus subsp. massiliense]SKF43013.1 Uncharacterised protein [Mycobacteroides abscessus subsp. massiliense]SKF44448.1 Uncharacterised protein [Mycobacteroides abscessus subsp. massiliense]SKF47622.1 Uncharacterised protein [Mycobacteroides abscessus subsp. massiliense
MKAFNAIFVAMIAQYAGFSADERAQIAAHVASARIAHGWGKEEAARQAGVSSITWKRVEDGLGVREPKLRAIEAALDWPEGTIHAVARENHAPQSIPVNMTYRARHTTIGVDEECAAMDRVAAALDELNHSPEAQARVARWTLDRYGNTAPPRA